MVTVKANLNAENEPVLFVEVYIVLSLWERNVHCVLNVFGKVYTSEDLITPPVVVIWSHK